MKKEFKSLKKLLETECSASLDAEETTSSLQELKAEKAPGFDSIYSVIAVVRSMYDTL